MPFFTTIITAIATALIGAELYDGLFSKIVVGVGVLIGLFWVASILNFGLTQDVSHHGNNYQTVEGETEADD